MYEKITLPNGVKIIHEKIPYVRSVALGFWVKSGSRYEPLELSGISHFIEHMLFKGTEKRSASDIAEVMDGLGGQINAFTGKGCTSYYIKTLDTHLRQGIEILSDMFFNSKFSEDDVNLERTVIEEEIGMYEDSPEDLATEKLFEACFDSSCLGRPILGTKESIAGITGIKMRDYMRDYYKPSATVISLCGNYSSEDLHYLVDTFSNMKGEGAISHDKAVYNKRFITRAKDYEQNHLCLGFPSIKISDKSRYALQLMGSMIGGGMSSRLFQEVREKHGLCYSIYSYNSSHEDAGIFNIYTALNKSTQEKALSLVKNIIEDFCEHGPSHEELNKVREQVKANILMGLESTNARMNTMARSELFYGRILTEDELASRYDAVTLSDIHELCGRIFDFNNVSLCAVGKELPNEDFFK